MSTSVTDLAIPTAGLPLVAQRTYYSSHIIDGPLGIGWIPNIGTRLYYATYLFAAPSTYLKQATVIMPSGIVYRFVQNTDGSFTPQAPRRDVLVQNADGTFDLTFQFTRSKLHFGTDGAWLSTTGDYGNSLTVTYLSGRIQRVADASGSGRYLDIGWGADGRISTITDSAGRLIQYGYTPQGALQTVTNPLNQVTTYGYQTGRFAPLLSQIKDHWNRVVTDVTYDATDRVRTYTEAGETYTYTYRYQGNPNATAKTDSAGNVAGYLHTAGAYITDKIAPVGGGGTEHFDLTADGLVQGITDPVGVKTQYAYDSFGRVQSVTRDYLGSTAVRFDYGYDPNFPANVTSVTPKNPAPPGLVNPDWQAWQYEYWQAGSPAPGALRFVKRVKSDGVTLETLATYVYNSKGQVTSYTSATGGVTDYGYDLQGNLTTVTGPANNDALLRPITTYVPDSLGRILSVTDPLGHVTSYNYDSLNRVLTVTLPKPSPTSTLNFVTTYSYDNTDVAFPGLLFTNVTDPNGKVTKQGYDQFGQLVKSIDAAGKVTTYGYDKGLLKTITDANGNVTTYGYDAGRRLRTTTFPDSQIERYDYWNDGLLQSKRDRKNQLTNYGYDNHKRLTSKSNPAGAITYTYVGQNLTTVVDTSAFPNETHTFGYDPSYRVQTNTQATRGTITYGFDAADRVTSYTVTGGPTATYAYYPDGSLNTIVWSAVAGQFKYTYTLAGQYQTITFPNGQTRNDSYDDQGRLLQLSNLDPLAGNLATYAYDYDFNHMTGTYTMLGQRVSLTGTVPSQGLSGALTKYEYDPLYQLTKATYPNVVPFNGEVHSWTYDDIGNRLTNTVNAVTQTYTYQKIGTNPLNWQRLLDDGVNAYSYDLNGSTTTRNGAPGNFTFGWDSENRMNSISGAATASYKYDYQGRRSGKTAGVETPTYLYDGLNRIQEAGLSPADYLLGPGIDEPLAMSRGGVISYYSADGLGSVALLNDEGGAVQNTYLYDAWGVTRQQTGSLANPFGYTSREFGEAGTLFYRARYYQPSVGRFLSEDPNSGSFKGIPGRAIALPAFDNSYDYVGNDPIDWIDPDGLARLHPTPTPKPKPPTPTPTPRPFPIYPVKPGDPDYNVMLTGLCQGNTLLMVLELSSAPRTAQLQQASFQAACDQLAKPGCPTYVTNPNPQGFQACCQPGSNK